MPLGGHRDDVRHTIRAGWHGLARAGKAWRGESVPNKKRADHMVARLLQISEVGLLERGHSWVDFRVDFKEACETDSVEHILDIFVGVE